MTSSKNTNSPHPEDKNSNNNNDDSFGDNSFNENWSDFIRDHAEDFKEIEKSKSAKIFKKRISQATKPLTKIASYNNAGPRDNVKTSWLDVDETMDSYGDDFVPPNPHFKNISITFIVLWTILILGILGVILSVLVPYFAAYSGTISAFLFLVGSGGLLMSRKKNYTSSEDYNDYGKGARV